VAATDRLSFRGKPFSEKTYQAFTAKQTQVIKAQQKRMKSTKVLPTTVPSRSSCIILPSAGNKEWVVEPPEGKVVRRPLATTRDPTWSAGQRHTKGRTQQRRQRPFEKNAISQTRSDDSQAMPTHAALR
jgi:hypothetical protein